MKIVKQENVSKKLVYTLVLGENLFFPRCYKKRTQLNEINLINSM